MEAEVAALQRERQAFEMQKAEREAQMRQAEV